MKDSYKVLGAVFVGSAIGAGLSVHSDFWLAVFNVPMVGSLAAALLQLARDQAAFERDIAKQEHGQRFLLGVSSHMANVAFDKHVEFAETYVTEAHETLATLFRDGPTAKALNHAGALHLCRQKFALWLTADIEAPLNKFELALRQLGAAAGYVESTRGSVRPEQGEFHMNQIHEMHKKLMQIMGAKEWMGEQLSEELAVSTTIAELRKILGTKELTDMRALIVKKASAELTAA